MATGKAALVTGVTGGMGFSIAKRITPLLNTLVITGRNPGKLDEVKKKIEEGSDVQVFSLAVDLENEDEILNLADLIKEKAPHLSFLIHCAGVIKNEAFQNTTTDQFDEIFKINARAPYILTRSLLPFLKKNRGQIVFVNSSVVQHSSAGRGLYTFSKIALKGIADVLRQELNAYGIKVVSIFPGQTATPMQQNIYQNLSKTYNPEILIQPEEIAETVFNTFTLSPTIEVTDIFMRPMKKSGRTESN